MHANFLYLAERVGTALRAFAHPTLAAGILRAALLCFIATIKSDMMPTALAPGQRD